MWIKTIVEGIVEEFQTRDVVQIIEALGIKLIKEDLAGKQGKFVRDMFGGESIIIDHNLSEYESRLIMAHELGHALLHTELDTSYYTNSLVSKEKIELQANKFAAELLISDENNFNLDIYDTLTIKDLSCLFRVPEEFIKLKFDNNYLKNEIKDDDFYIELF